VRSIFTPFVALALVAGSVDAIAFVAFEVFPANMTGNTALLGIAIASRFGYIPSSLGIAPPLIAIAAFIIGAVFAVLVMGAGEFSAGRAAIVAAVESVLIAVAAMMYAFAAQELVMPICITLAGATMGAQSVAAMKANVAGISTTYVTGTLVNAVMKACSREPKDRKDAAHDAWVWIAYLAGAVAGGALLIVLHRYALFPVSVFFLGLAAWFSYLSRSE